MPSILIVDDDPQIRHFLKRHFEKANWKVYQAGDAQSALQTLQSKTKVHAVVIDVRMPGPSGIVLLGALKKIGVDKQVPVVVMSGAASREEEELLVSLNPVAYLRKPVDPKELIQTLESHLEKSRVTRVQNGALGSHATHGTATSRVDISGNFEGTEKLLELVSTCLTVPAIIDKLSDAIESDTTGAEDIAEIARHDPSLTSRILKLVNSSFYTTNAEIVDLKTAVVRLGFDTVKNLILSAELFQHLRSCGNKPGDLDKEKLWLHSIAVAVLARRIGINLKKTEEAETYFVAGMLHDIGKALLHEYANNDYMRVCDYARKYQSHLYEAERHILQITHCAIAGQLLERWKLPAQIRELIVHHHGSPQQLQRAAIGDRRGAALLAIADYYVAMLGLGSSGHDRICDVETAYLDIAGISKADIQEAVSTFHADFVLTLDFLGASELLTQYQSSIIRRQGNAVIAGFDPAHGICASSIYLSHLGYRVLHVDNFNEFPRALSSSKPKVVVVYEYTVPKDERDTLMEVIKLSGGVERLALIGDGETAKRKNPGIPLFAASAKASTSASVLGA